VGTLELIISDGYSLYILTLTEHLRL